MPMQQVVRQPVTARAAIAPGRAIAGRAIAGPRAIASVAAAAPQAQAITPQQLAGIVGPADAMCMTQPLKQVVFQEELVVQQFPLMYTMTSKRNTPVEVTMAPQIALIQQPVQQVQLNSCLQQPVAVASCCGDSCNPCCGDNAANFNALPLEAGFMNPYPAAALAYDAYNAPTYASYANTTW